MHRFLAAIAMLAWTQPITVVVAQDQKPTDQELKAGYCLGYLKAQSENRRSICAGLEGTAQACPSTLAQREDERLRRITLYLAAKGFPNGAAIAAAQGTNDLHRCLQGLAAPEMQACMVSCYARSSKTPDDISRCSKTCLPDTCTRSDACETMDYLPY
jgi:hypothetical protein